MHATLSTHCKIKCIWFWGTESKAYLSNRKQRVKIGTTYSRWLETNTDVPQGSVLGPLLFNMFINDFIQQSEVCNFVDDNTMFSCCNSFEVVASSLQEDMSKSMYWFKQTKWL